MTNATSNILKMSQQKQIHIYYKLPDSYSNPGLISKLYTIKGEKKKVLKTQRKESRVNTINNDHQSPCIWELVHHKLVKSERHYNMS